MTLIFSQKIQRQKARNMRLIACLSTCFLLIYATTVWARPAVAPHGMVSSTSPEATQAGVEILKSGGNAADAAVAVALVLAVTKPYYGSLGGGGFMMVKFNGHEVEALDHRERAPKAAQPDMYTISKSPTASTIGGLASGVPGVVAGLVALHEKYGKLPWRKVVEPAIVLAKKGFHVSNEWAQITRDETEQFSKAAFTHYTNKTKTFPNTGDVLKQAALAKALELIKKKKNKGFYEGAVAKDIVSTVQKTGGVMTLEDLKSYRVRWLKPLQTTFKGEKVFLMPPPSSGGVVIYELLALAERLDLSARQPLSAAEFHLIAESMARAFSDRQLLGDPAFNKLPLNQLLSPEHIAFWAKQISLKKKMAVDVKAAAIHEGGNTTHYTVVDKDGQAVAATTTVNDDYGSGVVTEAYGINMNNEMDDFTTKPGQPNIYGLIQGEQNKVEPRKTPLSSMSPTIVLNDKGKVELALGAPGGPRIISGVFQVLYRCLTTDWDLDQAVQAPRIHHQFMPDKLYFDSFGHSPDTLAKLISMGHVVEAGKIAKVYAVRRMKNGMWEGAFDSRGEGLAAGY